MQRLILRQTPAETLQKAAYFPGWCAMAPHQKAQKLVRGTQSAPRRVPGILPGTQPHRTIMENNQTRNRKCLLQNQKTPPEGSKTRSKTKKINQNVPIF